MPPAFLAHLIPTQIASLNLSYDMKKYLLEIETRLLDIPSEYRPPMWRAENYIGAGVSKLKYLNLKIPLVRSQFKKGFSFSNRVTEEQWLIWDYVWNRSQIFEVMLLPSYWAGSRPIEEVFAHRKLILKWVDRVDNWAHSDELSAHYARLLEHYPSKIMPVFKTWNTSKEPWLKRQSMVGLLFYSRFRQRTPPIQIMLKFIERHINDDHYYVQKGVGWALRECWNVYPKETFAFLKKYAGQIPPAGWTAATEKLSLKEKNILKELRASARKGR